MKNFKWHIFIPAIFVLLFGIALTGCGKKYTIEYIANSRTYYTYQTSGNEKIKLPTIPFKAGHDFEGWYFDNGRWLQPFDETTYEHTPLTHDVEVYAKFKELEKHTISFYMGDQLYDTLETAGKGPIEFPAEPQKEYFALDGWFFDNGTFENKLNPDTYYVTPLTQDIKVYGKMSCTFDSNLEYELSQDQTYYIVKGLGECTSANIYIPDLHNGLPVKEIAKNAFYQSSQIEKVIIADNVEKIGEWAFSWCENLTMVRMYENSKLNTVGRCVFNCSKKLEEAHIPANLKIVAERMFAQCEALVPTIHNPENITVLGEYAFYETSVQTLKLTNITSIGENCFTNCKSLAEFWLPKTLTTIGKSAFNETRKLKKVEIEDIEAWCKVTIGGYFAVPWTYANTVYYQGEVLKNLVIPNTIKKINMYAFNDTKIETLTIPESVEVIESCAFTDSLRLKTIYYNATNCTLNLKSSKHHYYIFEHSGAYSLTGGIKVPEGEKNITVYIGANVQSIPSGLFYAAHGEYIPLIKTINFLGTTPPTLGENWFRLGVLEKINVPTGTESAYKIALGTSFDKFFETQE